MPSLTQVLDRLDQIDWTRHQHAYGAATDVPALIRGMVDEDEEVREEALEMLHSTIWHQGTVYEVSAVVAPFLIELLTVEAVPDKASILGLLDLLAEGHSYLAVHADPDFGSTEIWHDIVAKQGQTLEEATAQELAWVRAAHDAVSDGVGVYLDLVRQAADVDLADLDLPGLALGLLARFPERRAEIVAPLKDLLANERYRLLHAEMIACLGTILEPGQADEARYLEALLLASREPGPRFAAAVALACVAGEAAPAVVEEILLDVVAAFGARPLSLDEELALGRTYIHRWWHDWPLTMALAALARLGPERGIAALARALQVVAVPETAHEVVEALLDHAFGKVVKPMSYSPVGRGPGDRLAARYDVVREPPMRQPDTLTRGQRAALTALVACDPFWEIATNLLMLYGLPLSRETLVEWLSAP